MNSKQKVWIGMTNIILGVLGCGCLWLVAERVMSFDNEHIIYSVSDILLASACVGLCLYALYAFLKRKPSFGAFAFSALSLIFVSCIAWLCLCNENPTFWSTKGPIIGLVLCVLGLFGLVKSSAERPFAFFAPGRCSKWELCAISAAFLLPASSYVTGILNEMVKEGMKEYAQQQFVESVSDGERTDGDIIFKLPEDFTCDSVQVKNEAGETFVIFKLENTRTGLHSMLYGDQSNDFTIALFEHCWSEHFDPGYAYEDVDDGEMTINDHNCFFRRIKYLVGDTYVYWDLFVLCDPDNGKYALFQTYEDGEDIAYITPLLESIRFK